MLKNEYEKLLSRNVLKKDALVLFDSFEKYARKKNNNTLKNYQGVVSGIDLEGVKKALSSIRKEVCRPIKRYVLSLQNNLNSFVRQSDVDGYKKKFGQVLRAYLNVSRQIIKYQRVNDAIQEANRENVILMLGLVDIGKDDICINEEIDGVIEFAKNSNYVVFPVFGCRIGMFNNSIEDLMPQTIHFAGHSDVNNRGKIVLKFVDDVLTYDRLNAKINGTIRLILLNCCDSVEFVNNTACGFAHYTIAHEGNLNPEIARNFSYAFYNSVFDGKDILDAFSTACIQEDPCYYRLFP